MMTTNSIIIRYGELHLKGKNRSFFEKKLISNIKQALSSIQHKFVINKGRYQITQYKQLQERAILDSLAFVFGIHSYSVCVECDGSIDSIARIAQSGMLGSASSFKVDTHRADKTYPLSSYQVSAAVGAKILQANPQTSVDVIRPQRIISVDIRAKDKAFVYANQILGAGGMPYGTAGRGLLMLSGGIDSPVAGFGLAKRGMQINAVHFWSYPYTGQAVKQKVQDLTKIMSKFAPDIKLYIVQFTKIQEAIRDHCDSSYMITIIRRCMMKIMEKLTHKLDAQCIITGESLGQVASQTIESINVTNNAIQDTPIFRPLIGMDKLEIISIAKKIGTYDISILPYEDCCTIFMPKSPVTKPSRQKAQLNENNIPDLDQLIDNAVESVFL